MGDLDFDEDFEAFKKERRKSSYEETLAGMDPEILKELGLAPENKEGVDTTETLDLSLLPTETAEERMSRIEEKANKMVIEDDQPRKSRSRSRSRSKSRPPNLDTVVEQKKEEILEARFYGLQPSLDTIKESPSTASMLGVLQGGVSSASVNTVLQGSSSTAELHKDLKEESKLQKDHSEHKAPIAKDRISEEKDFDDNIDEKQIINDSNLQKNNEESISNKESKSEPKKIESNEECNKSVETKTNEPASDKLCTTVKKPKKKAQRSDTKLIKMEDEGKQCDLTDTANEDREKKNSPSKELSVDKTALALDTENVDKLKKPTQKEVSKSIEEKEMKIEEVDKESTADKSIIIIEDEEKKEKATQNGLLRRKEAESERKSSENGERTNFVEDDLMTEKNRQQKKEETDKQLEVEKSEKEKQNSENKNWKLQEKDQEEKKNLHKEEEQEKTVNEDTSKLKTNEAKGNIETTIDMKELEEDK